MNLASVGDVFLTQFLYSTLLIDEQVRDCILTTLLLRKDLVQIYTEENGLYSGAAQSTRVLKQGAGSG